MSPFAKMKGMELIRGPAKEPDLLEEKIVKNLLKIPSSQTNQEPQDLKGTMYLLLYHALVLNIHMI